MFIDVKGELINTYHIINVFVSDKKETNYPTMVFQLTHNNFTRIKFDSYSELDEIYSAVSELLKTTNVKKYIEYVKEQEKKNKEMFDIFGNGG